MFLLLHFGQSQLQIVNVFLELRTFILQLPLLGSQLSIDFLFILQSLGCLFEFGLKLNLTLDKSLTPLFSIIETLRSLEIRDKRINVCLHLLPYIYQILSVTPTVLQLERDNIQMTLAAASHSFLAQ